LAKKLKVTSSPTVLFFKDGKEIGKRLTGFLSKTQVRTAVERILGDVLPPSEIKEVSCDVLILGAGPAGLSAAIYASRAMMKTIVLDISVPGGQAASTYHVANYPGTPGVISGKDLIANMRAQALSFGAQIDDLKEISAVDLHGDRKTVQTEDTIYKGVALIIASGAKPRSLPVEGADEYKGRGVHYCATCDGSMYEGGRVVVVGGGNSALEEALYLARIASGVTIIHQLDYFQATRIYQEEVYANDKIDVIWNSKVRQINGQEDSLESLLIENLKTHELSEVPADGAFIYIGFQPATDLYADQIELDELGYIIAAEDTITEVPGVFVAGDIRSKPLRQVVTAAADGAVAGTMAERYVVALRAPK
jgi:thioredoxin reductase (NADPH)